MNVKYVKTILIVTSIVVMGMIIVGRYVMVPTTNMEIAGIDSSASQPQRIFQEWWGIFDRYYPLMERKNIDWQGVYDSYYPKINSETSDEELMAVFQDIENTYIKDGHTSTIFNEEWETQFTPEIINPSIELLVTRVTPDLILWDAASRDNDYISFGRLKNNPDIGYILSKTFEPVGGEMGDEDVEFKKFYVQTDMALTTLKEASAIIIDVRNNGGGQAPLAYYLAGRFWKKDLPGELSRYRVKQVQDGKVVLSDWLNEEYEGIFDPRVIEGGYAGSVSFSEHRVQATGDFQFTRPVVLLTEVFSASSAEYFRAAMGFQPHVTAIGGKTFGIFSGSDHFILVNGNHKWVIRLSMHDAELWFDGVYQSFEGQGIPPDIKVEVTPLDIELGQDPQMKAAVEFLKKQ